MGIYSVAMFQNKPYGSVGLIFCITPRESMRSCTIGDENSSCRPSHVPAGKNAPAGRF